MRKSPLTNLSFTLSGRIIDTLMMLFFFATIARFLGQESFGIFLYATSIATLLAAFSDLGASSLIIREIAKNQKQGLKLFSDIAGVRIFIIFVILSLTWAVGHLFFPNRVILITVFFLTLGYGLFWIADYFLDIFRGNEEMHRVVSLTLLYKVLLTLLGLVTLWQDYGLSGLIIAYLVAGGCFVFICIFIVYRIEGRISIFFNRKVAIKAVRESWPFAVPRILGILNIKLGLYFLFFFSAIEDVGVFGASLRLMEALLFIPWTISVALFPNFVRLSHSSKEILANGARTTFKILVGIILPIALGTQFFSKKIIFLIYGQNFLASAPLLCIHIWVCFFYFLSSLFAIYFQATYQQKTLAVLGAASLCLHALFALILIPLSGASGAAYSAFFTEFILLIICMRIYSKKLNLFKLFKDMWKIILAGMGMLIILFFFRESSFFVIAIAGGISYIMLLLLLKPFSSIELSWLKSKLANLDKENKINLTQTRV